jgi:hypothetical protein
MGRRKIRDTEMDLDVRLAIRAECDARGIKMRRYWEETGLYKDIKMTQFYYAMAGEELDIRTIGAIENSLTVWRDIQSKKGIAPVSKTVSSAVVQLEEIQRGLSKLQADLTAVARTLVGGANGG